MILFYTDVTEIAYQKFYVYIKGYVDEDNLALTQVTNVNEPFEIVFIPYVHARGNTAPYFGNYVSGITVTTESDEVIELGVPFDNEFDSIYVESFEVRLGSGDD